MKAQLHKIQILSGFRSWDLLLNIELLSGKLKSLLKTKFHTQIHFVCETTKWKHKLSSIENNNEFIYLTREQVYLKAEIRALYRSINFAETNQHNYDITRDFVNKQMSINEWLVGWLQVNECHCFAHYAACEN